MLGQEDRFIEPKVQIGDYVLSEAQAMAVRVAITSWHSQLGKLGNREAVELGELGRLYHDRLSQVLDVWLKQATR